MRLKCFISRRGPASAAKSVIAFLCYRERIDKLPPFNITQKYKEYLFVITKKLI
jgi:hypothetical protein